MFFRPGIFLFLLLQATRPTPEYAAGRPGAAKTQPLPTWQRRGLGQSPHILCSHTLGIVCASYRRLLLWLAPFQKLRVHLAEHFFWAVAAFTAALVRMPAIGRPDLNHASASYFAHSIRITSPFAVAPVIRNPSAHVVAFSFGLRAARRAALAEATPSMSRCIVLNGGWLLPCSQLQTAAPLTPTKVPNSARVISRDFLAAAISLAESVTMSAIIPIQKKNAIGLDFIFQNI